MKNVTRGRAAAIALGLACLTAASLGITTPAYAAVPAPSTTSQAAASNTVAAFDAANPVPVVTAADPAVYAKQSAAALTWWKTAPVDQMLGQYGCTQSGLDIGQQSADDGVAHTTISMVVTCADPTVLASTPVSQMTTPRFATASSAKSAQVATPNVTYGKCSTHGAYCIHGYSSNGELEDYYQYQGTASFTGHVRSGRQAGACSPGTLLANSPNHTLTQNQAIDMITYDYNSDSTYSDENVTSGGSVGGIFCQTF